MPAAREREAARQPDLLVAVEPAELHEVEAGVVVNPGHEPYLGAPLLAPG